jgi:single-strand DNA-binding protein
MANDANKTILIGRLTRDPEMRYTPAGTAVASFTLANGYSYKQGDEKKETSSFFDCVIWGKPGEFITEYAKKGQQLYIEGRLSQRRWDDQDGNKKSKIEIVVDKFQFLGGKKSDGDNSATTGTSADGAKNATTGTPADNVPSFDEHNAFSDDDIPF